MHTGTHTYKKNHLFWGNYTGDSIFLLHLKTSTLSCRSFLETPLSINARVRHPILIKPPSLHALAVWWQPLISCSLTYLCFRCVTFLFFFSVMRGWVNASRRDCVSLLLGPCCKWLWWLMNTNLLSNETWDSLSDNIVLLIWARARRWGQEQGL